MQRFKNILVVVNDAIGDDETLTLATKLATKNDARLTVIEVVNDQSMTPSFVAERKKRLCRLTETIQQKEIRLDTTVSKGILYLEVIRQVIRQKHDLVMMVTDGGSGYKKLFFGSDTLHLLRKCPCPVWITKPGVHNNYLRIMAAIGPLVNCDEENALNRSILDLATSIAKKNTSELHIVHSWDVSGNDSLTLRSEITPSIEAEILQKHEIAARKPLDSFLERYDLNSLTHNIHLRRGALEFIVPELVTTADIDLIVMGTIKKSVIPGYFVGNTAESIFENVSCAVLAVKPENFVTPVTLEVEYH